MDPVHNATYYNIYSSEDNDNFVLEIEGLPTTSWIGTISQDKKFFKITANK